MYEYVVVVDSCEAQHIVIMVFHDAIDEILKITPY